MKTAQLIQMLAQGAPAVDPYTVRRRYVMALGLAACATLLLMVAWLGFRRDMGQAVLLPMFWVKLAFPGALLAGAVLAALRLSRDATASRRRALSSVSSHSRRGSES